MYTSIEYKYIKMATLLVKVYTVQAMRQGKDILKEAPIFPLSLLTEAFVSIQGAFV